jgi:hypothetical protein
MYTFGQKIKWSSIRIWYYLSIALTALTGGLYAYITIPYFSYIFFNDLAFWKHGKHYPKLIGQLYRIIYFCIVDPRYRAMYSQPLAAPPSSGPDQTRVKLSDGWISGKNDCARCVNCCIKIKCPLMDDQGKKCLVYNSVYWRYFSCGRFPVSQRQIDYYECPKWEMRENMPGQSPVGRKEDMLYT